MNTMPLSKMVRSLIIWTLAIVAAACQNDPTDDVFQYPSKKYVGTWQLIEFKEDYITWHEDSLPNQLPTDTTWKVLPQNPPPLLFLYADAGSSGMQKYDSNRKILYDHFNKSGGWYGHHYPNGEDYLIMGQWPPRKSGQILDSMQFVNVQRFTGDEMTVSTLDLVNGPYYRSFRFSRYLK